MLWQPHDDTSEELQLGRVPWSRHPDDVEPVIGILLCRRHPSAQRIRPSQGDRGIDVLFPAVGGHEVYQVKSFARNLIASQKAQIARSFHRLKATVEEHGIDVVAWHLTLPLNPTNENLEWLAGLTADAGFRCDWFGLDFVEGLAAQYPDVIDYYLRDGKERLESSIRDLTAILHGRQARDDEPRRGLDPADLEGDLRSIHRALNAHDPHYRYSFRVDHERNRPETPAAPGLVAAQQVTHDGVCVTHYIFARYSEATEDRPIPLQVRIAANEGSQLADELVDFQTYGTSLTAPPGTVTIEADLPGGLGGRWSGGSLIIGPAQGGSAEQYVIRVQVLDPAGNDLGTVRLRMEPPTSGFTGRGVRAHGIEEHGVFSFELRTDLQTQTVNMSWTLKELAGKPPAEVIPALRLLSVMHHPNAVRVGAAYGLMDHAAVPIPISDPIDVSVEIAVAEALAAIQDHTTEQLSMLPVDTPVDEVAAVLRAAKLLRGETVTLHWKRWELGGVTPEAVAKLQRDETFTLAWRSPLVVRVGGRDINLGWRQVHVIAAQIDPEHPPASDGGHTRVVLVPAGNDQAQMTWLQNEQPQDRQTTRPLSEPHRARHREPTQ